MRKQKRIFNILTSRWVSLFLVIFLMTQFLSPLSLFLKGRSTKAAAESWETTSITNAPSARTDQTTVWTGSKMIIWGGRDNSAARLNTGGVYDPKTDQWTTVSTINAPAARYGHTAVWTGTEMIIWGGYINDFTNTGASYNPTTNTWTTLTMTGAPAARFYHSAVWTGTKMIIWGGFGSSGLLNTGASYSPLSGGSWTETSTTNAPVAGEEHTAIWTGTKMIIWGGISDGTLLNRGSAYDPALNSWEEISDKGDNPTGRRWHTAVWTGTEMIIWGGSQGPMNGSTNTGGRYDPESNTWTATSTDYAPVARNNHTATMVGSKMIIWGGLSDTPTALNLGGIYDPSDGQNGSWLATTVTNAPSARFQQSMAPTGSTLGSGIIVWGGQDGNGDKVNTGGVYYPATENEAPTASLIYSPNRAVKAGEVLTITALFSEAMDSYPVPKIAITGANNLAATDMTRVDSTHYTYDYSVGPGTGTATVSLSSGQDLARNPIVSTPTNNATFTVDNTAPNATVTTNASGPVKSGDIITTTATFNEAMAVSPVPKIAIAGANTLAATNMTRVDATHYTYSHTVGAGNGAATFSLTVGTDVSGNVVSSAPTNGGYFTVDNTAPAISGLSPADNVTGVAITNNLGIVYAENVTAQANKNITIKKVVSTGDITAETIAANNTSLVTISGRTITINPSNNLANLTDYYILIDAGAFKDSAGNPSAVISSKTTWNFKTVAVGAVSAPTFNQIAGRYDTSQDISLATATAGAIIKFTADGTTPTAGCTNGTTYSAPISVDSTATIKAIACKAGYTDSTVVVATYVISPFDFSTDSRSATLNNVLINFGNTLPANTGEGFNISVDQLDATENPSIPGKTLAMVYEITPSITATGSYIATVTLPYPSDGGYKDGDTVMYWDGNTWSTSGLAVVEHTDSNITFTTTHFSEFGVAQTDAQDVTEGDTDSETDINPGELPETGSNKLILEIIVNLLLSLAIFGIIRLVIRQTTLKKYFWT